MTIFREALYMLGKLSIVAVTLATLLALPPAHAQRGHGQAGGGPPGAGLGIGGGGPGGGGPGMRGRRDGGGNFNRNFQGGGGPVIGRRYHGGVWYGTEARRFWRGRWYPYGVGPCWLLTPIGYVWTCG